MKRQKKMEREKMVNDESYEQIMLANAVGNDDPVKMIIPVTKTFRGSKKLIE